MRAKPVPMPVLTWEQLIEVTARTQELHPDADLPTLAKRLQEEVFMARLDLQARQANAAAHAIIASPDW